VSVEQDEFCRLRASVSEWSDKEVASKLGIHPTVVWKYRVGKVTPSITILRLFALITGQRLTLPSEEPMTINDQQRWLEPWEEEVSSILRPLDPDARKSAIQGLRMLIGARPRPTKYRVPQRPDPVTALADEITAADIASVTSGRVTVLGAGASAPIAEPRPETASAPPTPRRRAPESRPVSRTASKPDPKHSRLAS
jgi:hypothetical protein